MKIFILFTLFFIININSKSFANLQNCNEFKKFSIDYLKCKGNKIKEKTISTGQNIIKDTKDYQNKKWSEEKEKMNKVKDKINKTKEKVLNQ